MLLAPFYAIGFRGESILWPAWALSFRRARRARLRGVRPRQASRRPSCVDRRRRDGARVRRLRLVRSQWHGGRSFRLADRVCNATRLRLGRRSRCAQPAWLLHADRACRALSADAPRRRDHVDRPRRRCRHLPRLRAHELRGVDISRGEALAFVVAALSPTLLLLLLTGSATSSTAQVKLLPRQSVLRAHGCNARQRSPARRHDPRRPGLERRVPAQGRRSARVPRARGASFGAAWPRSE